FTAADGFEGSGSVSVTAGSYTDLVGNTGSGNSANVTIDTKNPTVMVTFVPTSLSDSSNSSVVSFSCSEAVMSFTDSDVGATHGTLSPTSATRRTSYASSAAAGCDGGSGAAIATANYTDLVGNTGSGNSASVTIDTKNPTVMVTFVTTPLSDSTN